MSNIEKYQQRFPERLSHSLINSLFENLSYDDSIQLEITIESFDLGIREFSTYLHFIYKVDGLLSDIGFLSYSKLHRGQIRITKIEQGSIVVLIEKLFSEYGADRLIIIWLALKYLPRFFNGVLETAHKYYDTLVKREEYLEKSDRRKIRKEIRDLLNEEAELLQLDKKSKEKLVNILDELYLRNANKLKWTSQFGSEKVKDVKLKAKRKNNR